MDGVLTRLPFDSEMAAGIRVGANRTLSSGQGFAGQVCQSGGVGSQYRLVRLHTRDGREHALFRLSGGDGLNYHDFRLSLQNGRVLADDIYVYMSGEYLSETIYRTLLPAAQQFSKNWVQKLAGGDRAFIENFEKLQEMNISEPDGARRALRIYRELPRDMQEIKSVQILRYHAASMVGNRELLEALDDFERLFPGDPALALLSLDALAIRKQYEQALQAIDELDRSVGGDPYLDVYRCSINLEMGDLEAAERYARELLEFDPDNAELQFGLVSVLLAQENHAAVLAALQEMDRDYGYEWGDLRNEEAYASFVASDEGKQWLRQTGFLREQAAAPYAEAPTFLVWSDASGKFNVEAQYVESDDQGVTLRKRNGKVITVPLGRLSDASRQQAAEQKKTVLSNSRSSRANDD
ncbi:hypothetical protein KOR34_47560 [Posidoniimonas corsicana]|uniref:SLA1 homology domain-containing protein n=2 Tax=Posidoniimonas corsicana TaxID=1938618 RepID=A0A5C5UVL2_9BACT|nr:hypothetical protein KOR34_47560 [Posidoniimonas corsicana]